MTWAGRRREKWHTPFMVCRECGVNFQGSENTDKHPLQDHLIEAHGYKRVGGQVFKPKFCACGKPGLYQLGSQSVCAEHKNGLAAVVVRESSRYDRNVSREIELNRKHKLEAIDKSRKRLHQHAMAGKNSFK